MIDSIPIPVLMGVLVVGLIVGLILNGRKRF
jgi:hypothetical protein